MTRTSTEPPRNLAIPTHRGDQPIGRRQRRRALAPLGPLLAGAAVAASATSLAAQRSIIEDLPGEFVVVNGQQYPLQRVWKPICGSSDVSPESVIKGLETARAAFQNGAVNQGGAATRGTAFGLTINTSGTLPAGAQAALDQVEAYFESFFTDEAAAFPIICNVTFSDLGGFVDGIITLGSAGSTESVLPYATIRDLLRADADADDRLPGLLPNGSTIPADFASGVTSEDTIDVNLATVSVVDPTSASTSSAVNITFNNNPAFVWDFDPANGIASNATPFRTVVAHEIVHGLGFRSEIDSSGDRMTTLDMFRFRTSDRPTSHASFETKRRYMRENAGGEQNVDFLEVAWPMEDGDPNQGSHFLDADPNTSLMDPLIDGSLFPNYLRQADIDALDALGYDIADDPSLDADEISLRFDRDGTNIWSVTNTLVDRAAEASFLDGIFRTNTVNVENEVVTITLRSEDLLASSDGRPHVWVLEDLDFLPEGFVIQGVTELGNNLHPDILYSHTDRSVTVTLPAGHGSLGVIGGQISRSASIAIDVGPPNDDCQDAIAIACGDSVLGTTDRATNEGLGTCRTPNGSGGQVWYTVVGTGGRIEASTSSPNTDFDTKLFIFEDACGTPVCITGDDDDGVGSASLATWNSTAGTTYYILVGGFSGDFGAFELSVTCLAPPNDACADAIAVTGGQLVMGSLAIATNDGDAPCGVSGDSADVWYTFTAPCSGQLAVGTCGTHDAPGQDLGMDTLISLHNACAADDSTALDCSDDSIAGCPNDAGSVRDSFIARTLAANETVLIRVAHYNASLADGLFQLNVDFGAANDDCANATTINCGDTVTACTDVATSGGPEEACGTSAETSPDVWYTVIGNGDLLTAATCNPNTDFDTKIRVYEGSCGAPVCVTGNDDGGPAECVLPTVHPSAPRGSIATWQSVPGAQYLIVVEGYNSESGTFEMTLTCETVPDCPCDFDTNDTVDVLDLLGFLALWFNSDLGADYNSDTTVDVLDLLDFLSCWFDASAAGGCTL